ncbi:MAG: cellulase family glycosylhydrolase [Chitinophagaceae bacterium]
MAFFIVLFYHFEACNSKTSSSNFIQVQDGHFVLHDTVYTFKGCNYWYGGYLYSDSMHKGKERLRQELDFLENKKIKNIRVFICSEGDDSYPYRIYPSLQSQQGVYHEELLKGFDYLLVEAAKRDMKIVFVLNNNWEWSGGFGQYIEWQTKQKPPFPKTAAWDWEAYCQYISKFYTCDSCMYYANAWIKHIVNRTNTFNQLKYSEDPTIMSWELANEPRPMDSSSIEAYQHWIQNTSALIKSIDKNHLVTIGTEGIISCFYSETIYKNIHAYATIDYATLHLWPKTWQWYNGESKHAISDTTLEKTKQYIALHTTLTKHIKKPLVIEEFGMHRDGNSFSPQASTYNREEYFRYVYQIGQQYNIAGYNFWGFAGMPINVSENKYMQKGMAYSADPPQEEQGLYSVFMSDSTCF